MKLNRVGVDLAKNVYQLHGVDRHGKTAWKRRLRRGQWLQALLDKTDPGCEIGMEACLSNIGRYYHLSGCFWGIADTRH